MGVCFVCGGCENELWGGLELRSNLLMDAISQLVLNGPQEASARR